jgi:hypothetical protein
LALHIRHPKDFYAGLIFIAIGALALLIGRDYSLGTTTRMGPGYFPALLGWLLTILGVTIALRSLVIHGPPVGHIGFRPLALILASMLAFAGLLEPAGLVIATAALIAIGCLGSVESRARDVIILSIALIAVALGLFVYGLGLPMKIWPGS